MYIYINYITKTEFLLVFKAVFNILGYWNQTLHLYMVTATNLVLKFRSRANIKTLYSVQYDLVVVVISIIGSSEKFSYRMVRS
jgi:hypothetical protein